MDRKALDIYREWNESKKIEQAISAETRTIEERWMEYNDLMSLCWALKPEKSLREDQKTMDEWKDYYQSIKKFEKKRKANGEKSSCRAGQSCKPS
ncbi:MAG: hypothetical protein AB2L14_37145 [Candidatus Xenobiia bacterium LiM19]